MQSQCCQLITIMKIGRVSAQKWYCDPKKFENLYYFKYINYCLLLY